MHLSSLEKIYPANTEFLERSRPSTRAVLGNLILVAMFLLICGLYPFLLLQDAVPLAGIIALGGLWLIYWVINGRLSAPTPLDLPILLLLSLLPLSLAISVDPGLTMPKVYGLVLGIALFYVIVNFVRSSKAIDIVILALIILALGVTLLAVFAMDWSGIDHADLDPLYTRLPHLTDLVTRSEGDSGMNGNTIGGALAFLIPLLLSLIWDGTERWTKFRDHAASPQQFPQRVYKLLLILVLLTSLAALFLSQSRGAMVGTFVGILVLAIWKDRRFLWTIPIMVIGFAIAFFYRANVGIQDLFSFLSTSDDPILPTRWEVWRGALYLIRDLPITGGGLGTFSRLFSDFYSVQNKNAFHAHNFILTIAADQGIPALVLYMALLGNTFLMAWRLSQKASRIKRVLAIGLCCGLLAHHVFGLADSYMLGAKLGVILWIYFGLISALYIHSRSIGAADGSPPRKVNYLVIDPLIGLVTWILISCVAIALVNFSPYISLAVAAGGGLLLGVLQTWRFHLFTYHADYASAD